MTRYVIEMGWDSVPHLSDKNKQEMLANFMPDEREVRSQGRVRMGAGLIYPTPEDELLCDPFEFPAWYRHAYGMDVGWQRTAAIWGALDPETDVLYLYSEHYRGQAEPPIHAAAIKARGAWIPGTIDPASRGRSQADGKALFDQYVQLGLQLTPAKNAVESGIYAVWQRESTGRLKIFRGQCQNLLAERRVYRRDENGKVHEGADHGLDSERYLCVTGVGIAVQRPPEQWAGRPGMPPIKGGGGMFQSEYAPFADSFKVGNPKR
jgi:Terminase RNaseH-like domain